jgi:hypothetical protein
LRFLFGLFLERPNDVCLTWKQGEWREGGEEGRRKRGKREEGRGKREGGRVTGKGEGRGKREEEGENKIHTNTFLAQDKQLEGIPIFGRL